MLRCVVSGKLKMIGVELLFTGIAMLGKKFFEYISAMGTGKKLSPIAGCNYEKTLNSQLFGFFKNGINSSIRKIEFPPNVYWGFPV